MGLLIPTNVICISLYRNKYICWNCTFSFQEFLFEKCYLWTCIITLLFCYVLFYPLLFCDFNAVTSVLNRSNFLSLYPIFRVEYAISYHFLKTLWVNYIWFVRIPTKTTFTALWRQVPCVTENGLNKRKRERESSFVICCYSFTSREVLSARHFIAPFFCWTVIVVSYINFHTVDNFNNKAT